MDSDSKFFQAIRQNDLSRIRQLAHVRANLAIEDGKGVTPLLYASAFGSYQAVKLLADSGADVNARDAEDNSALHWAACDAIQKNSASFFRESGCVGCHHQPTMAMAVKAARAAGIHVDEKDLAEQRRAMAVLLSPRPQRLLLMESFGGGLDTISFSLIGLQAAGHEAGLLTDSSVAYIAARQSSDGGFKEVLGGARAPLQASDISRTALCLRALRIYPIPARKAEFERRIARARAWLLQSRPRTIYERAELLMGLHWAGASSAQLKRVARTRHPWHGCGSSRSLALKAGAARPRDFKYSWTA